METHGVKHHYHHLHQASQPSNHLANHNSLTSSQPFSFGSNPSQGQNSGSKLNFENSTAFPLLLSSIESGRQNFSTKPTPYSRPKSTFSHTSSSTNPPHNAAGNVNNHSVYNQPSQSSSSTLAQFSQVGAGKHRPEPNSHHLTNGGVKATPKPKSAATPNLITSSGRQQATFGHSSTNGHSQAKSSHLTGEAGATLASSALPFKKNLLTRETPLNNNGTCNRSRTSPNKENNKTAVSLSSAPLPAAPTPGAPSPAAIRRPSIRSPTRASGPASKQSSVNNKNTSSSSSANHNHSSHNHVADERVVIVNGADQQPLDRTSAIINSVASCQSSISSGNLPKPKPREFKFFKEKAKDKLHKSSTAGSCNGDIIGAASKSVSKTASKSSASTLTLTPVKATAFSGTSNGAVKKTSKASTAKADKSSGPLGKTKNSNNSSSNSEATNGISKIKQASTQPSSSTAAKLSLSSSSDVATLSRKDNGDKVPSAEAVNIDRVIFFTERLVDNFTFQCFAEEDSLECSLQDAVSHNLAVLNYPSTTSPSPSTDIAPQQPTPLSQHSSSSHSFAPPPPPTTPATPLIQPPPIIPSTSPSISSSARVIFRRRSPSPSSSSDAESDSSTIQNSLSSRTLNGIRSPLSSSRRRSKPPNKANKVSRRKKPTKSLKKPMAKDSKTSKKKKSKENKEIQSDDLNEDSDGENLDEEGEDEEATVNAKANRKSKVKTVRCTHKYSRSRTACNRCLLLAKKKNKIVTKKQANVGNKKAKTSQVGRKAKCKNSKATIKKAGGPIASTSKAKRKQARKKPINEDEDSFDDEEQSGGDDDDDEDQSDSSSDDESDATQEDDDEFAQSDQSEECEDTKRTIADLIKCSTRREAVRKAAERAALASVNARSKANRATPATATTEASAVALTSNLSSGPPATSDTADVDLSSGKNSKLKKMSNKTKSSGAASTVKGKRSASNKRSQSDFSSNEDDESSESDDEEAEPITSPRRGRVGKKASKAIKSTKRSNLEDDEEHEDAEAEESDSTDEQAIAKKVKAPKRNVRSRTNNKQHKTKDQPSKPSKGGKVKSIKVDSNDNEDEVEDANMTDREEEVDQNMTDAELDDEKDDGLRDNVNENVRRPKAAKGNQSKGKEKKPVSSKAPRAAKPACKPTSGKARTSKNEKATKKSEKVATKKSVNDQSDDDTEQSDQEDTTGGQKDAEFAPHAKAVTLSLASSGTNPKNKCDKPKAKAATEASSTCAAASNNVTTCPVKDVYTFELSPAEVPSANTRLVLSSGHENKVRAEGTKAEISGDQQQQYHTDSPLTCASSAAVTVSTASLVPVKSSFSPQIISGGPLHREGPAFEPLRPDAYSHYEPSYGPNASLSSLSQLSQSIGGGAGPILLNHQSPSANNKCQINIKEEPRDEGSQSSFRVAHPKAALHRTPPPVVSEHLSTSQNYGTNFVSSVNNKATHPRRLWSNASAGSLISSSSSSSSSPVHLAFGQCPPGPPTPATPASLASYFTPSNSLPALSSPFYPPTSQDLIRRELDSRILASTVSDRNLLSSSLGIPPPAAGSLTPILPHTPFNHAPTSPMIPTTNSSLITTTSSSATSFLPSTNSNSLYPISSNLNHHTAFTPSVPIRSTNSLGPQERQSPAESPIAPPSRSQSPKVKPILADVKKGTWSSMHIKIARDIQQKQNEKCSNLKNVANNSTSSFSASSKTTSSSHSSRPSSKSSSSSLFRVSEPPAVSVHQQQHQPIVSASSSSRASTNSSSKNSPETTCASNNSVRPSSATTFNANYPPRYGTPFGTPSISAPPILPGLFPSSMSSAMSLPGFLPDGWPRLPIPGQMAVPNSMTNNRAPVPFMFPDYYANVNSASSALSAWAAGIRPPGDAFTPPNKQPAESIKPTAASSSSSSHKRKHDDLELHGRGERAHSSKHHASSSATSYQNGDIRSEQSNKKSHSLTSASKHHKSDSGASSKAAMENGERSRAESHGDFSSTSSRNKPSKSSHEPRHDNRYTPNFNLVNTAVSSAPSPSPFPCSPYFSGSHSPFPPPSDHQRYMELLGMPSALGSALPPHTNSFMAAARNNVDLPSRPMWPFGIQPSPNPATSSVLSSSMMPDPFKSLQDISLRPGLVPNDRETLFSRYSLLNSSGGGASIFDKMNKEQMEKFEMLQGHIKPGLPSVSASNSRPSHTSSEHASSSRSTPTHRMSLPPPPPPTSTPTSMSSGAPPPTTPFPYPNPYLNPLHHLSAASSFLSQPMGHHPSFVSGNPMLNGVDSLSKMAFGHPGSMPSLGGMSSDSQFMLPPHFPPPPGPGSNMMNFLKGNPPSSTNYNSTR